MKILLHRYHPVVDDLAISLTKLGHNVTISFNLNLHDHYGSWAEIMKEKQTDLKEYNISCISLTMALQLLRRPGAYSLVGVDGVFDGDSLIISVCRAQNIPYFCIQGYPGNLDEPSDNILSLGWSLPYAQYSMSYPAEVHKKQIDWKNVAENGQSAGRNICVFYPQLWYLKGGGMTRIPLKFISGIQRYEECNKYCYDTFTQVKERLEKIELGENGKPTIENIENKSHKEFLNELGYSAGLIHLKFGDQPGISVLEAMKFNKPVITMKSFVLSSHNADLLIDNYSAIICDTIDELIERVSDIDYLEDIGMNGRRHASVLCSHKRQEKKLQAFLERCIL